MKSVTDVDGFDAGLLVTPRAPLYVRVSTQRRKAMTDKGPDEVIDQLSPSDAVEVLRILAHCDAKVAAQIVEVVASYLRGVDVEEVAGNLYDDLSVLRVEEVWDRAGNARHGYVEPSDAAYEMIEEVLRPYLEALKKYQGLGMRAEANQVCMGLLWAFHSFEYECDSEFKDWAPDAMSVFADTVVETWRGGEPAPADVKAVQSFMEEQLQGWGPRVD
jgi:hypothetical protein